MNLLIFLAAWAGAALLLAYFSHRHRPEPQPKHSEVFPLLPCDETVILTTFGPGAANTLREMEYLGLVTRYNGYVVITRLGEGVMS